MVMARLRTYCRLADAPVATPVVDHGREQPEGTSAPVLAEDYGVRVGVAGVLVPDDHAECVVVAVAEGEVEVLPEGQLRRCGHELSRGEEGG